MENDLPKHLTFLLFMLTLEILALTISSIVFLVSHGSHLRCWWFRLFNFSPSLPLYSFLSSLFFLSDIHLYTVCPESGLGGVGAPEGLHGKQEASSQCLAPAPRPPVKTGSPGPSPKNFLWGNLANSRVKSPQGHASHSEDSIFLWLEKSYSLNVHYWVFLSNGLS